MKSKLNSDSYRKWSGYLAFVFLLASCAPTAHIEKDDNADLSHYKTFSWIDVDGKGKNDRNKNNDLNEQKVRQAVSKELQKDGGKQRTIPMFCLVMTYWWKDQRESNPIRDIQDLLQGLFIIPTPVVFSMSIILPNLWAMITAKYPPVKEQ